MRFIVKREEFLKALLIAGRAVNSKSSAIPALSNFKLDLDEYGLAITGSNYELTIKTTIPTKVDDQEFIRNIEPGSTLINAKIITDMARKIESEELSLEVVDSTIALITGGKIKYNLNCIKVEDYPDVDLLADGTQLKLTKVEFSSLVNQTAFAASQKEQRPILTAMHLEAEDGVLTATTTDSARMARKQITVDSSIMFSANVPAKMMVEVDHLLELSDAVTISFSDKKALFEFDNTIVATRLVVGEYPNTKNIIPHITNHSLEVNAQDLIKAIDRVNILSIDRENVVDLQMNGDVVEVSAKSTQVGSASEKLDVFKFDGEPLQISFNSEFVLSAIRALESEDVTFLFVGEMKPFVIKNAKDESVVQIVTPVRTY
ncbi:MAG: DNA polymerase III subunit beta [Bacilli bacterium]|nr:DNA polymerase III subunit beta [Bacilli bacterium]